MSQIAIKVDNIAKRYTLDRERMSKTTARDALTKALKARFGRLQGRRSSERRDFWALDDISTEIKHGEIVGIIGHNGAGKSTLLKILSRITEPTKGSAEIYGRVGSLLEVGTGFHPELTGRENVYLSGAIMGMKRSDIKARFDKIVAFAGVERFLDTPIKHYSSGMYLRLAFAVAAHLEPDILLVDEVLAVGDLEFQNKCLNKMGDVATEGRTVLFVSHNMGSIKELCKKALVLKSGRVDYKGDVVRAIQHYTRSVLNLGDDAPDTSGNGWVRLSVDNSHGICRIVNTDPFEISATLALPDDLSHVSFHCYIDDAEGTQVVHNREVKFDRLKKGRHNVRAVLPPLYLKPGVYTLHLKLVGETPDSRLVRYFSERLILDTSDATRIFTGKVRATIIPPVHWTVEAARAVESSAI